ncbi:MAG: hypothetical protein WCC59_17820 [Terriglobales bacterium]
MTEASKRPKIIVDILDAKELPRSRFGTNSAIRETPEWTALMQTIEEGSLKRGKMLRIPLTEETLGSLEMKRPVFNFAQYLKKHLRAEGVSFGKVYTRRLRGQHFLFVTAELQTPK